MIRLEQVSLTTADYKPQRLRSQSVVLPILQDVSVVLDKGQTIGVVGATGTGKTSLLKLLNRLVDPSQGRLSWNGQPYPAIPILQLRRQILLVPQDAQLLEMTVADALVYGLKLRGQDDTARRSALTQWQERLQIPSDWLDKTAASLPTGQRRWVTLARGIACEPEVLLLDEPTANLDQAYTERLQNVLKKLMSRSTQMIVVVSHDWQWLEKVCDRVLYLADGRLIRDVRTAELNWTALRQEVKTAEKAIVDEWS